jgi:hypothetical protein
LVKGGERGSVENLTGDPGSQTRFGNRPAGNSVSRVRQAPAKRSFADKVPKPSLGTRVSTEPVCVSYLGGKLDSLPRPHAERGNEESSTRKRRTPRSSRRVAGGCGATGGPRCHGWQRGPGTHLLVVQGLAGPRKARCHVATHFKAGNEGPTDQDRQRQRNALAQADSQSAARARMGRAISLPRGA